jgi:hypothetical protein
MYSKGHYARRRFFSSVTNFLWSVVMLVFTLILIAVFAYGCLRYWRIIGPEIE